MNDLETTKMQTPIEIALGIDENGMTTAKKRNHPNRPKLNDSSSSNSISYLRLF